jgi:hypothetical protein
MSELEELRSHLGNVDLWADAARRWRRRAEVAEAHALCRIWQERPDEVSWACICGFVSKHMRFDEGRGVAVPRCPDALDG